MYVFFLFIFTATPQPDISPSAKEVEPPGTVKVTWKDAREQRPIEVEYTILYRKDGDKKNKVKSLCLCSHSMMAVK